MAFFSQRIKNRNNYCNHAYIFSNALCNKTLLDKTFAYFSAAFDEMGTQLASGRYVHTVETMKGWIYQ